MQTIKERLENNGFTACALSAVKSDHDVEHVHVSIQNVNEGWNDETVGIMRCIFVIFSCIKLAIILFNTVL